jgi:hydroxymethylpyrimidine/phosphomethylpyrimidine kinase
VGASLDAVVLAIGGVDPSGGAGVYADLDAVRDHRLAGAAAVAALTAQSSHEFLDFKAVAPALLARQLEAVAGDVRIAALKIGMLGSAANVRVVEEFCAARARVPVVLDPVLMSTSGGALARDETTRALAERLVPRAALVTPNVAEAMALTGVSAFGREGVAAAAAAIVERLGAAAVVVTGGDAADADAAAPARGRGRGRAVGGAPRAEVADCFLERDGRALWLRAPRVAPAGHARTMRGTGCRFATAVACGLASGEPLLVAVRAAKRYVARLIATRSARLGKGAAQAVPPSRRADPD